MKLFLPLCCLLLVPSCTSHVGKPAGPAVKPVPAQKYEVRKDVTYTPPGWPEAQRADLYLPQGAGPWPGVLLIHGGGWTRKERRSDMTGIARSLVRRGYVVMNVTYRLAPKHLYPAALKDLQEALAWMRRNSADLRLRPGRIASFGYSAGGHLAALLASIDAKPEHRVQAVVAGGAPTDMRKFSGGGLAPQFLGGRLSEIPKVFAAASPITHITRDDPPVFLYHGGKDKLVPPDHATDYRAALTAAGIPNELFWLEGRGHIAAFLTDGKAVKAALEFLDRTLLP